MTTVRQPSFARGEFSRTMWARTEFDGYRVGARTLLNFVVNPHGAALNRPGTLYVGRTALDATMRMREFRYGESDTLLLVFTPGRLRFFARAGGQYGEVLVAGVPLEVVTPYQAADLERLRFAQIGNEVRIGCRGYDTKVLTRTGTAPLAFTFITLAFDVPAANGVAYLDATALEMAEDATHLAKQWSWDVTELWRNQAGLTWETTPNPVTMSARSGHSPWLSKFVYPLGATVNEGGHTYTSTIANNVGLNPTLEAPPGTRTWSVQWRDDGAAVGSSPEPLYTNPLPARLILTTDNPGTIIVPGNWGLTVTSDQRRVARRVYRRRGKLSGYVGEFEATTFVDVADDPVWALSPPKGENPFVVEDINGNLVRVEQPGVLARHDQRFVAGGTAQRVGSLFFSALDDASNFDTHDPLLADDAFSLELAAEGREELRALVSGAYLWAFTDAQEWAGSGGGETGAAPLSATAYGFRARTSYGSGWVEPVKAGDDEVFFFPAAGDMVRRLAPDANATLRYVAEDETVLARHLFLGKRIVARAFQRRPFPVLWVAWDDGTFGSLSWSRANGVMAWTPHYTDGAVEDLCVVREDTIDALYLGVKRTIGGVDRRYIERLAVEQLRKPAALELSMYLDAALTYVGAPASHFTGLDHLEGRTIVALADANVVRDLVVAGGAVDLPAADFPDGASTVSFGLPYRSDFASLDTPPGEAKRRVKVVSDVTLEVESSRGSYVGTELPDGDSVDGMEEVLTLEAAEGLGPMQLRSGVYRVPVAGEFGSGGRCAVRHVDPLPLTLLAVTREVDYGG